MPISTTLSPSDASAIVISRDLVLSPHHISPHLIGSGPNVFGSLKIRENGADHIPEGSPAWVRYRDDHGIEREEHASNYRLKSTRHEINLYDHEYSVPYRSLPSESVNQIAVVKPGDMVTVASLARRQSVSATVVSVDAKSSTIVTDFRPELGDSGSLVTVGRKSVGLVVGKTPGGGSIIIVPEPEKESGTTYNDGYRDGQAAAVLEIATFMRGMR